MPLYAHTCENGHTSEHFRPIARVGDEATCPVCGLKAERDFSAEGRGGPASAGVYYSEALGVSPHQIEEAKQRFPHHEFTPDGRMVIRGHQHRKQVLKELGYRDWDSYD